LDGARDTFLENQKVFCIRRVFENKCEVLRVRSAGECTEDRISRFFRTAACSGLSLGFAR